MSIQNRSILTGAMLAAALTFSTFGRAASADDFELSDDPVHLDELAAYLQQHSNSLCWEMHRSHRQQPDFTTAYRAAKEIWSMSGAMRDSLRAGPIDANTITGDIVRMHELFMTVEKTTSKWGDGLRPAPTRAPGDTRTVVVTPGAGVDIDIPFIGGGVRVGTPRVVVSDQGPSVMDRRRFHPHARGSQRALARELAGVRTGIDYLLEDTGAQSNSSPPTPAPPEPAEGPELSPPLKISPPAPKK
jgi:hypothetical protein